MSSTSESQYPYQPEPWQSADLAPTGEPSPSVAATLLAAAAALAGCLIVGLLAGVIWNAVAPKAIYVVIGKGSADVVNAETSAFVEGDAWFVLIAVLGGLLIGLVAYRVAIRKYGPAPMVGVLVGSMLAGLLARWAGQSIGMATFNKQLLTSRSGALLHAPPVLGAQGSTILWPAIVFWPLAACLIPACVLLLASLRDRQSPRAFGPPPGAPPPQDRPPLA